MRVDPGSGTASRSTGRWRVLVVAAVAYATLAAPVAGETSLVAATTADPAQAAYDRMSQAQRIGQLFMVGTPVTGLGAATRTAIGTYHVGNVLLTGRTTAGPPPVRASTSTSPR